MVLRALGILSQIYRSKRNPRIRSMRMRGAIKFRFKTIGRRYIDGYLSEGHGRSVHRGVQKVQSRPLINNMRYFFSDVGRFSSHMIEQSCILQEIYVFLCTFAYYKVA